MDRAKVALLGLQGVGSDYLTALQVDDQFELLAVADRDPEMLRRYTEGTTLRGYTDYRSAIVETAGDGLDLLFVALEPFQSNEFVHLAAERGIGVFHRAPWARNVSEAERLLRRFSKNQGALCVSRPWQAEPAFAPLRGVTALVGRPYIASAEVRTDLGPDGWRGDSARAGGGVLLNDAYEQLDLLVHLLGVPEVVYARCSAMTAPGTARSYDTEDAAVVSLLFGGERIGCLSAWRGAEKPSWCVTLVGATGTVDLNGDRMIVRNSEAPAPITYPVGQTCPVAHAIHAFGAARRCQGQTMDSADIDHLRTMAVIEAAYLSARTAAPESPSQFLP